MSDNELLIKAREHMRATGYDEFSPERLEQTAENLISALDGIKNENPLKLRGEFAYVRKGCA